MSIAFVVFQDHPDFLKSISEQITKAIGQVEGYGTQVTHAYKHTYNTLSKVETPLKVYHEKYFMPY